jgi:hypothetical protein
LLAGLTYTATSMATGLPKDVSAAAELLQRLDATAAPSKAASERPKVEAAPQPRPPALPVFIMKPRPLGSGAPVAPHGAPASTVPEGSAPDARTVVIPPAPPLFDELGAPVGGEQPIVLPPINGSDENAVERVVVRLDTSVSQVLDGSLSISVIQAAFRGRQLSLTANVLNEGRTPYRKVELGFWIEGGGRQKVRISELRPGQARNINVRVKLPRGDRPDTISVTSAGRLGRTSLAERERAIR